MQNIGTVYPFTGNYLELGSIFPVRQGVDLGDNETKALQVHRYGGGKD